MALSVKLALSESPRPLAGMLPYGDRTFLPAHREDESERLPDREAHFIIVPEKVFPFVLQDVYPDLFDMPRERAVPPWRSAPKKASRSVVRTIGCLVEIGRAEQVSSIPPELAGEDGILSKC